MGLQTSNFGLSLNLATDKTEKPLKQKCVQIKKQSANSYRLEVADDEHGHN